MRKPETETTRDSNNSPNSDKAGAPTGKGTRGSFWRRWSTIIAYVCVAVSLVGAYSVKHSQPANKKTSVMSVFNSDIPSKTVPEGKTAGEYYVLALQYKLAGWPEHARVALTRTIQLDEKGPVGLSAKRFLLTKIPRYSVPEKAISMNISARNATRKENNDSTRNTAEEIWKQCITEFPKFEWPYGNLGDLYMQEGKYKEADELLTQAITINPNYVNGWMRLAECKLKEKDKSGAQSSINKAMALDPDDLNAKYISFVVSLYTLFQR